MPLKAEDQAEIQALIDKAKDALAKEHDQLRTFVNAAVLQQEKRITDVQTIAVEKARGEASGRIAWIIGGALVLITLGGLYVLDAAKSAAVKAGETAAKSIAELTAKATAATTAETVARTTANDTAKIAAEITAGITAKKTASEIAGTAVKEIFDSAKTAAVAAADLTARDTARKVARDMLDGKAPELREIIVKFLDETTTRKAIIDGVAKSISGDFRVINILPNSDAIILDSNRRGFSEAKKVFQIREFPAASLWASSAKGVIVKAYVLRPIARRTEDGLEPTLTCSEGDISAAMEPRYVYGITNDSQAHSGVPHPTTGDRMTGGIGGVLFCPLVGEGDLKQVTFRQIKLWSTWVGNQVQSQTVDNAYTWHASIVGWYR
jgi:hypothetical protein